MTERVERLREALKSKAHHRFRREPLPDLAPEFSRRELSDLERATQRYERVLESEEPVIFADERIVLTRTVPTIPEIHTGDERRSIEAVHHVHELGRVFNIAPRYAPVIRTGLAAFRREALSQERRFGRHNPERALFLRSVVRCIDATLGFADRYADEATRRGKPDVAEILRRAPRYGAGTFREALQVFRLLHYCLWAAGHYHVTVGRFDQYMYPYLEADLMSGLLDEDTALELLQEYFLTFNRDSDLYPGMQQGDNGQSLVIGGVDRLGNDAYNLLSELCLEASLELRVIDPKINLRVHSQSAAAVYESATRLTAVGLGFPQYSNDDVVIPGLLDHGYALEDARDYCVAACWEFIVPGSGMDVPNMDALSFPEIVDKALRDDLPCCTDYDRFEQAVCEGIVGAVGRMVHRNLYMEPAPLLAVLMDGCVRHGRDPADGLEYNNYGIHGVGLADAVESLSAVRAVVFRDRLVSAEELVRAVDSDFHDHRKLLADVRNRGGKMGNDDDETDAIASTLLAAFADSVARKQNDRGGRYRAGTGSAMYYLWFADEIGASPNGRLRGEPFSANYSPSLTSRLDGPLSIINSFTKPNLRRVINGGPLTLEVHDTVFRTSEGIPKTARLVKYYFDRGGHQLQLNSVNRAMLLAAQADPKSHRNLIVRVWGWSGYFVDLDKEYQDHILRRVELSV